MKKGREGEGGGDTEGERKQRRGKGRKGRGIEENKEGRGKKGKGREQGRREERKLEGKHTAHSFWNLIWPENISEKV